MRLKDDLIAAKALIDTPEKWGKGNGRVSPQAPRLCVLGACRRDADVAHALADALPNDWGGHLVHQFNDHPSTTHADIMALFDRAIAKAAGEQP